MNKPSGTALRNMKDINTLETNVAQSSPHALIAASGFH